MMLVYRVKLVYKVKLVYRVKPAWCLHAVLLIVDKLVAREPMLSDSDKQTGVTTVAVADEKPVHSTPADTTNNNANAGL